MLLSDYVTGNGCIVMERRIWYNRVGSLCLRDIRISDDSEELKVEK